MEKSEIYYQYALGRLQEQDQRNRDIELKVIGIFGVAVTVVGFGMFLFRDASALSNWGLVLMAVVGVAFLLVLVSVFLSLLARNWRRDPPISEVAKAVRDNYEEPVDTWLGRQIDNAVTCNEKIINTKALCLNLALGGLSVEVVFLFIVAMLTRYI